MNDNNNDLQRSLKREERVVADRVADEILEQPEEDRHLFLILLLLLLFGLLFLVSSVSFAIFGTQFKSNNVIKSGSILFSYEEESRGIYITNAYPIPDEEGKRLSKDREYFDFEVSYSVLDKKTTDTAFYQISLVPDSKNTLDSNYVRVYLLEDGEEVSLCGNNKVCSYSKLKDSKIRNGAKMLLKRKISDTYIHSYTLRLWVSYDYTVSQASETFRCYVAVDGY